MSQPPRHRQATTVQEPRRTSQEAFRATDSPQAIPGAVEASSERFGGFSSELEAVLANRIAMAGLPIAEHQFRFCPARRWRADFAYPSAMLLIEVDGGTWNGGRHVRGKGFEADCEKTSTAAAMGFRVIRLTRAMVEDGRAVLLIRQALEPEVGGYISRAEAEVLVFSMMTPPDEYVAPLPTPGGEG